MGKHAAVFITCLLLLLAMVPWIVSNCSSQPLLPDELKQERENYETGVAIAQDATIEAMRKAPSSHKLIVIESTVIAEGMADTELTETTVTPTQLSSSPNSLPSNDSVLSTTSTPTATLPAVSEEETTSVIAVHTAVATQTLQTTTKIIVHSDSTPDSPEPLPSSDNGVEYATPFPPQGMVEKQDIITEEMLTVQIRQDADDNDMTVSDLQINITPDGVEAIGITPIFPGVNRPIKIKGGFIVEKDSLLVTVTSISLDNIDVTELYSMQLEDRISWSLYQLLPQRYVKSYQLLDGRIIVNSQVKP